MKKLIALYIVALAGCGPSPSAEVPPDLSATVQFQGGQLVVTNTGPDIWREVRFTIDPGGFIFETNAQIAPKETVRVGLMQFANREGERFNPILLKPSEVQIAARLNSQPTSKRFGFQ